MQPRLTVGILVLQAEGLVSIIRYSSFLFQTAPAGIIAEPQQITVLIGHLSGDGRFGHSGSSGVYCLLFAVFVGGGFDRRSRVRAYRSCPKSGSEVSYGLRFAITYLQNISC